MDDTPNTKALLPGAELLVQAALDKQRNAGQSDLGTYHWLLALLERHGSMAKGMVADVAEETLPQHLAAELKKGNSGPPLARDEAVARALAGARARGATQASERDLAAVILSAAGYRLLEDAGSRYSPAGMACGEPVCQAGGPYAARPTRPTPTLERYGRDLTREAVEGRLGPLVGRDLELQLVTETLCRRSKRNPVLVGPAGVGKTAIVEGLAQKVARGDAPAPLLGVRIIGLQPSTLVAGAHVVGELEKRVTAILSEASQEGIILFIDEMHSMVGAGGTPGSDDVASLLKPALARGDVACIAATTDDEYRRFIEPDGALERRFQPVRVQELSPEQTLQVLMALREQLDRQRGVHVPDEVLRWLVSFAQRFMRNRYFPDKGVDLLEQCVAHALATGAASVGLGDAQTVAERMVGMPAEPGAGLEPLRLRLRQQGLLSEQDAAALMARLAVTLRGLDLRPARPNAVLLLLGEAADRAQALAEAAAETLLGSTQRVVEIDLSRLAHGEDVTLLVGAPPGYVGYADHLPIHRVAQMPWCVLVLKGADVCHGQVRAVLSQALADGYLTDGSGKRIYLSDALVLLTARHQGQAALRPIGFLQEGAAREDGAARAAEEALGPELAAQVDLVIAEAPGLAAADRQWLEERLLADLTRRYGELGLALSWDAGVVEWLQQQRVAQGSQREWERLVDERISPLLVRYLAGPQSTPLSLTVYVVDGELCVSEVGARDVRPAGT